LVIVNWNTCAELKQCLNSFYEKADGLNLEIIVVDNASSDDSVAVVKASYPGVLLIANKDNKGFACGVNQGIRVAAGKFILVLNSDIVYVGGTLSVLIKSLQQYPDVAAVAPRLLNPDGSLQKRFFRKFPTLPQIFFFNTTIERIASKSGWLVKKYFEETIDEFKPMYDVQQIPGGCIMVRREAVESVGLMDEQFILFFEDVDWCYRMKKAGWKLRIINTVPMIHLGGRSFQKTDRIWMLGRFMLSLNQYIDKHGSYILRIITKLLTVGNSTLIFLIRSFQLVFNKELENNEDFRSSYRGNRYLLKLFYLYYIKKTAKKDFE
jgi:GT2 family glycosyltransferase